jgi:3-oxoacyl-[acyl-carrier protein] reductase
LYRRCIQEACGTIEDAACTKVSDNRVFTITGRVKYIMQYGKVDILVNNAAAADDGDNDTIDTLTQSVIDYTFATNVRGTLLMIREFVKRRGNYGRIINFSTDAAQAFPGVQITYSASKAAIEAFTRNIAIGVGKYGITVNCISPGPTQTGWIDEELAGAVVPEIPLGRLIKPQEIAETIVFLASERAAMVSGQVIKVSGGHAL